MAATAILYDADYVVTEDHPFKGLAEIKIRALNELRL